MKIAVIGSGISGLTCAHLLNGRHDISLFEQNSTLGGHTATKNVMVNGQQYAIDTGFIVFNDRTYPLFEKLLSRAGVSRQKSEMSFSVKNLATGLEYNGHTLNSLFAQRRNLLNPAFYRFLGEIARFNRTCKSRTVDAISQNMTMGDFLERHGFSAYFTKNYLLPMGAAIWSASLSEFLHFPLDFFIRFFSNHGLLNIVDRPQWYVIPGGSRSYIGPLLAKVAPHRIHTDTAVTRISRNETGAMLSTRHGDSLRFDQVIIACHSDQALAMLSPASHEEKCILGAIGYQDNDVVLHTDTRVLPRRPLAHASWNYLLTGEDGEESRRAAVTYNMNILQGIASETTFLVSLNLTDRIDHTKILGRYRYAHPSFSLDGMRAREKRSLICGQDRIHYCGAYWYNGFHEDGVRSALDICRRFGADL